ncbi:MAG: DUF4340 domain-containing protein [Gammaproteobacteria bacterium]|nr:DUF4340 domain-containing protein [Gammaproteobacteria bacterium]MCW9005327.1 DUF4340 domain-containing protein [Gammaproteobacteria bacterium]MCW9056998.1 DUF4340 domain-containing protein [Gammaproteobacteria bacterium]
MNTRSLVNIVLLIIVIALASFILWQNNDNSYLKLKLTDLDKSEIKTITIPREKGNIVIQRSSSGWFMQSPYTAPAHNFRINQLLNLTQLIAENSYDIDDMDLAQFNLAPSDTTIIFNNTTLEFGNANPISLMRYVKSGNKLFLVKDNLYPLLRSQPSSFISLSLLPEDSSMKSIALPDFTLIKNTDNSWTSTPEQKAGGDAIPSFIQQWQHAKAFGVHAYMERKKLGLIRIQLDDQLIIYEITDTDPWLILARKDLGLEYHLDKSQVAGLLKLTTPDTDTTNTD